VLIDASLVFRRGDHKQRGYSHQRVDGRCVVVITERIYGGCWQHRRPVRRASEEALGLVRVGEVLGDHTADRTGDTRDGESRERGGHPSIVIEAPVGRWGGGLELLTMARTEVPTPDSERTEFDKMVAGDWYRYR